MKTVNTYLPVFSGFYGTIWEADEDREIEYLNEQRAELGKSECDFDDMKFNYRQYDIDCAKGACNALEREMKEFVSEIKFQKVNSPRYYNFSNDSIDVEILLSQENINAIRKFITDNSEAFETYLKENYTSYSGFISHYPNNAQDFIGDFQDAIEHAHKLGSILNFIAEEIGVTELGIYEDTIDNVYLECENFQELLEAE